MPQHLPAASPREMLGTFLAGCDAPPMMIVWPRFIAPSLRCKGSRIMWFLLAWALLAAFVTASTESVNDHAFAVGKERRI